MSLVAGIRTGFNNKAKPSVLNRVLTALFIIILWCITLGVVADAYKTSNTLAVSAEQPVVQQPATRTELFRLVNEEREKVGVAPLVIDERLNQSAQKKADEMIQSGDFGHINADGTHGYQYAIDAIGTDCKNVSENYTGFEHKDHILTAESAIESWMGFYAT